MNVIQTLFYNEKNNKKFDCCHICKNKKKINGIIDIFKSGTGKNLIRDGEDGRRGFSGIWVFQRLQDQPVPMLATRWPYETRALCGCGSDSSFKGRLGIRQKVCNYPAFVFTASPSQTFINQCDILETKLR